MTRVTSAVRTALLVLGGSAALHAQRAPASEAWRMRTQQVHAHLGVGVFSLIRDDDVDLTLRNGGDTLALSAALRGTPAFNLSHEFRLNSTVSIGPSLGVQRVRASDLRLERTGEDVPGSIRVTRTLVGARVLFHYARRDHFELYSGLRGGITVWRASLRDLTGEIDSPLSVLGVTGVLPQVGIIPIGAKAYFGGALSLGAELQLGSPHFAAVSAGVTF